MPEEYEFRNLDSETRKLMICEVEADIKDHVLYYSKLFTNLAIERYPDLLRQAILGETPEWLRDQLLTFNSFVEKTSDNRTVNPPASAQLLAGDEFNRFYCRALCLRVINGDGKNLRIYRARISSRTREESLQKIGSHIDAKIALPLFRTKLGTSPGLGVSEVGSGLSLEIVY